MCIRDVEKCCYIINMTVGLYLYIFFCLAVTTHQIYVTSLEVMTFRKMDVGEIYITSFLILGIWAILDHVFLFIAMVFNNVRCLSVFVVSMIFLLITKFCYHMMLMTNAEVRVGHNITFWNCVSGFLMWGLMFHGTIVANSRRKILSGEMERQKRIAVLEGRGSRFDISNTAENILV